MKRRAFTLIELLTVMAISAILLGIIVIPLIQSFNLTRAAQAFADAQDRSRVITERLSREIGNAVSVRSQNGVVLSSLNGALNQKIPAHSLIVEIPGQNGNTVEALLPYAKLDIVPPAEGESNTRGLVDPDTGYVDPTLESPKGQVVLPVVPGNTLRRYFIGRRDPFKDYNNPYDGILMSQNATQDNLYVLYAADVNPFAVENVGGVTRLKYFLENLDVNGNRDLKSPIIDDPRFFTPNRAGGVIVTNDDRARIIGNWLGIDPATGNAKTGAPRRATIQTEISRYDMIQVVYDQASRKPEFNGNIPRLVPLIQFRPAHVDNEAAEGQVANRKGEESDGSDQFAPDVYRTNYALLERPIVRNWPRGFNRALNARDQYSVMRSDPSVLDANGILGTSIFVFDPDAFTSDVTQGTEVFDVTLFDRVSAAGGPFPFSQAVAAADARSNWLSSASARSAFVPYLVDSRTGKIFTSFNISDVGDFTATNPPQPNLPLSLTSGPNGATTPLTDNSIGGVFSDANHAFINDKFNKIWKDYPGLQPRVDRFIDLRVTANQDGTVGPLDPTSGFARAVIVPGSDEVYGPDQLPGPHMGLQIRYTRTTQEPGPNQYRINYSDLPEPTNPGNGRIDYSIAYPELSTGDLNGFDPDVYDSTNIVSAVLQPRYKKGYIKLNSDPNNALPVGEFRVAYKFQFNSTMAKEDTTNGFRQDVFAVDYDTRQLIDVLLTIRNYPQASTIPNPQTVTLKSTAAVRNYIR